jgi:hypothetical protein
MKRVTKFLRDLVTDPILFAIVATIVVMLMAGCGKPAASTPEEAAKDPSRKGSDGSTLVVLTEATNLRFSVNGVVEKLVELPAGSEVALSSEPEVKNPDYRNSDGRVAHSEIGFFHPVRVVSVPKSERERYPQEIIQGWNSIAGGLYISAAISETALPVEALQEN